MLCAFEGPPRILRLHGRGAVLQAGTAEYEELLARVQFDDPSTPRRAARSCSSTSRAWRTRAATACRR